MNSDEADDQYFGLTQILQVLGRRWRWLLAGVVLGTGAVLLITFQQSTEYSASVRMLLRTVASETLVVSDPNAQVPFYADRQLQNEIAIIESQDVREGVEDSVDPRIPVQSVSAEVATAGADEVVLTVKAGNAEEAALLADAYAQSYIEYSARERLAAVDAASREIQSRLDALLEEREALAAPLSELDAQLVLDPNNQEIVRRRTAAFLDLSPQLEVLDNQRAQLELTQEQLALTRGLARTDVAQVVDPAEVPGSPTSPKPIRNGVIGFVLGLGLGIGLAFLREYFDQSIRNPDDLDRAVKGRYPTLGVIPHVDARDDLKPITGDVPTPMAEAFRALRTSVRYAGLERVCKVIQITTPSAGEGKTTTSAYLAHVLGQAGHRVTVVCCDFRRPRVHEMFDLSVKPGFADVVVGDASLADAIVSVDGQVHVLPAGSRPPNPSELLGSDRAERLIQAVADEMEYVIVDSTPTLPVTDAVVASRFVDATIVVVRAGETGRNDLRAALETLELASAPILGVVLTGARSGDVNSYGYDYGARTSRRRKGRRATEETVDESQPESVPS